MRETCAGDGQRKIIGGALGLEIVQDRKIEQRVGDIDPAPQRFAVQDNSSDRVVLVSEPLGQFMRNHRQRGLAGRAEPDEVRAQELRMQRAGVQRHPKQWQAGRQQAPGEFVQGARAGRNPACRADQPLGYCIEGVMNWALPGRPLEHFNGCSDRCRRTAAGD